MLEFHRHEIRRRLKMGLFRNPSAKNAISAWEYMQSEMTDAERQTFALRYAKTFAKVTDNLPSSYLDKDSSGFQAGVLDDGTEHDALLLLLRDKATWHDPGLAKLVLSMVFQAFDKKGGFTGNTPMPKTRIATEDELLALDALSPKQLLDNIKAGAYDDSNNLLYAAAQKVVSAIGEQKFIADPADEQMLSLITTICSPQNPEQETLNDLLAIKYAENQGNAAIRPVLDEMHVTINGYQPPESKGPYKEYSFAKLIVGSLRTLRDSEERKGVKLAYLGLKNTASVKGFSLDALQESAGGTLAGVQFGKEGESNTALLDFDADFKNGTANVDALTLPFQSINYLSDSFTFKTDTGHFNTVHAHFEWPESTKEEELQGLGKVEISISDMLMNNLRVIFDDETYGLSKLALTGLKATIYQPLGKLNTLEHLRVKFIDVFYDISQFITYALQLSINRFSPDTGPDAKESLSEVLARTMYEGLAFEMTFTSLDIENLLIIDNDYPDGRTVYPVDPSQEFMKKIHLGQTSLSINSKTPDPEIENYKIKQNALDEKRELTDAERETIRINKEKAAELHVQQAELRKKKARLKKLLLKNEKGETGKRNDEIKKLQDDIAATSKPEFHLTFETSELSLDNPDMMNKIIAGQTSSLADNTTINTLPGEKGVSIGKTRFETDFTQDGLTNTSLFISDLVIPDVTMSAIHYKSEDNLTALNGDETHLSDIKASFNVYFKDQDPENPDVLIDHIDVLNIKIVEASVTSLMFGKDTPGKEVQDPHTLQNLIVPKGERIIINDLFMQGWKIAWDDQNKMSSSMMDEKSMQDAGISSSKIEAGNLLIPKGTRFTQEEMAEGGSTIIASTLDAVSFKTIKFAAARNPDSKAIDKIDYTYSYDDAEGVIRLQKTGIDKNGKPTDLGGDLNVGGTKLSNGLYYKESEDADVISFSLNKINLENFHYISDKFNIHANKPTVFNDIGLNTLVTYNLDKDNKRTGVKSVMLRGFTIDNIRSNDLEVYSFTKKNDWMKVILPGLMESGLNKISVSGLGYDFETKKPLYSSSTDISVGIEDTIPALFVPKLQTIFGNKFAADYSKLKVGTIHLHMLEGSDMAALDVEGIVIDDMEISKFNVGDSKMKITSCGKNAHLKVINADVSFVFDPGFSSKKKSMIVNSLTAEQLVVYGLKITKGPAGKEEMVVDLKPEEKSTIDDISIENFVVNWDEAGKTKVDYSKTVASTGKVDAADLSIQIGKAFSMESGVEASGITFKGLGGEGFELNISDPELTNIKDKSPIAGTAGDGKIKFGNEGKGPVMKGSALVLKKGKDGKMSYALKDPEIKGFKVDLPEKGMHLLIDANMIGGELDVNEGLADFGGESANAWIMTSTEEFAITVCEITVDDFAKLKSESISATSTPYDYIDVINGTINLSLWGHTVPVKVTNGMVGIPGIISEIAAGARDHINAKVVISPATRTWLDWMAGFAEHVDEQWQRDFFAFYAADNNTAIGMIFEQMINDNTSAVYANDTNTWRLRATGFDPNDILADPDIVENARGNYDSSDGGKVKASAMIDCIPKHLDEHTTRQEERAAEAQEEFIQAHNITNEEYEEISGLPWEDPDAPDDVIRHLDDETYHYYLFPGPDPDLLDLYLKPWIGAHVQPLLMDGLDFSFSGELTNIDAGKLIKDGFTYKDKTNGPTGTEVKIGEKSTSENIFLEELKIPAFSFLNEAKNFKLDTSGISMHSVGGLKLNLETKPNSLSGTVAGSIINPGISIKK